MDNVLTAFFREAKSVALECHEHLAVHLPTPLPMEAALSESHRSQSREVSSIR